MFLWSVLAHLHPIADQRKGNPDHVAHYKPYENELDMNNINYPVKLCDIDKFETQNPGISVSVFVLSGDNYNLSPIRIANKVCEKHIQLGLITGENGEAHYFLIKDLSHLVSTQISKHKEKKLICESCLNPFRLQSALDKHKLICQKFASVHERFPVGDRKNLKFTKYEHQLPASFMVVADIETLQVPEIIAIHDTRKSGHTTIRQHKPCSAGYHIISTDTKYNFQPKIFRGEYCIRHFLDELQKDYIKLKDIIDHPLKMSITDEQQREYDSATICSICDKTIDSTHVKVADHCHLTGQFRGAAHQACNLNYRLKPSQFKLPIFFHNLKGYDAHFIIKEVDPRIHGEVAAIAQSSEKYISFQIGNLVFKDSLSFLLTSLESAASKLNKDDLMFTKRYFENQAIINTIPVIDASQPIVTPQPPPPPPSSSTATSSAHSNPSVQESSVKRKSSISNNTSKRRRRNIFIDDEADISGEEESDEENDNDDEENSLDTFINDEMDVDEEEEHNDEQDPTFYYRINNLQTQQTVPPAQSKSNNPFKMHSITELPNEDYRKGNGYQSSILNDHQQSVFNNRFQLVTRKGVYPYDYIDSFDKFNATSLPSKQSFYNHLKDAPIKDSEYDHAQNVFNDFEMNTLGDYHDLYLVTDILLLADVFTVFRRMCLSYYKIDPVHCYTTPGLSWQAALRMTDITLELLDDVEMHQFIEVGVRGGVSVISCRHVTADEDHALFYVDANNLYGEAMSRSLPTGQFRWLSQLELEKFDISKISEQDSIGYILEVDADYPHHLHDKHNEYPLAPQRMEVTSDMLSDYQKDTFTQLYNQRHAKDFSTTLPPFQSQPKLAPNLYKKNNYIVHGLNLKFYIENGLVLTKIHRVLQFNQSPWLKPYIDFNTQKRAEATNDFEKDLFKLMNNAVFGKTLQNPRKQRTIDFVSTKEKSKKLISHPLFKAFRIINDNLYAIERSPTSILFNKPIYVGFTVLELSKLHMYDFHYNHIKKIYPGDESQLCFTDTDSFLYCIKTKDVYADMMEFKDLYDFSNFPNNHECFKGMSPQAIQQVQNMNEKKIGKMKDEMGGIPILEFVGLRSKMYSFRWSLLDYIMKLKGIPTAIVQKELTFGKYKQSLLNQKETVTEMKLFRSNNHHVTTVLQSKVSLSCFDDKRYILHDGVTTLAHGHYAIDVNNVLNNCIDSVCNEV